MKERYMKTIEEAQKCICPQLCIATAIIETGHMQVDSRAVMCQADKCMMWRKDGRYYDEVKREMYDTNKGYCGLAGNP